MNIGLSSAIALPIINTDIFIYPQASNHSNIFMIYIT